VREALESVAAAAAAQRISPDALSKLDGLCRSMNEISSEFQRSGEPFLEGDLLRRYLALDLEFHQIVVEAAGNRYLSKIISETRLLVRVFTSTFWRYDREKLDEANRFHRRLLEALRCKDVEAARIATVEAMHVSRDNALRAWDQHVAPALETNEI
jgi:DNA-binding FadR family transcriptional regulator